MKFSYFERQQALNTNITQAWDFISNPKNLNKITPKSLNFKIISNPPEKIYSGLMIEYKIGIIPGFSHRWLTKITDVEERKSFIDAQKVGPYKIWSHKHSLKETTNGVLMRDQIYYMLPLQPFSLIISSINKKRLKTIFDYRKKKLNEIFST